MIIHERAESLIIEVPYVEISERSIEGLGAFLLMKKQEHDKTLINRKEKGIEIQGSDSNRTSEKCAVE